jgi:hypothetical protein
MGRGVVPVKNRIPVLIAIAALTATWFAVVGARGQEKARPASLAAVSDAAANEGPPPFELPAQSVLKGSAKKVFAHYFTPYPISLDDKAADADYYTRNYLTPGGEGGKHAAYGGHRPGGSARRVVPTEDRHELGIGGPRRHGDSPRRLAVHGHEHAYGPGRAVLRRGQRPVDATVRG